jgi:hypothetical protein
MSNNIYILTSREINLSQVGRGFSPDPLVSITYIVVIFGTGPVLESTPEVRYDSIYTKNLKPALVARCARTEIRPNCAIAFPPG